MRHLGVMLMVVAVAVPPRRGMAQTEALVPGAKVRVTTTQAIAYSDYRGEKVQRSVRLTGLLEAIDDEWVTLAPDRGAVKIPRTEIVRIEVSRGRRWWLIGVGAGIGYGITGLVGATTDSWTAAGVGLLVIPATTLVGVALGANERWTLVGTDGLQVSVRPVRNGAGAQVAIGF